MNDIKYPIEVGYPITCRAWHRIDVRCDGMTEAMNLDNCSVLLRTTFILDGDDGVERSVSTSMLVLADDVVAQRWSAEVCEPWFDDESRKHVPGKIRLTRQLAIIPRKELRFDETHVVGGLPVYTELGNRFRWYRADDAMPAPTDEQVHAYLQSLPEPSEVDSLRRELAKMRERYLEAELRVSEARGAKEDDEDPWIWSDDETAKDVDGLGNMMVVKITGGHLRALLAEARTTTPI
jgi:hypothetical protein